MPPTQKTTAHVTVITAMAVSSDQDNIDNDDNDVHDHVQDDCIDNGNDLNDDDAGDGDCM